MPAIPARCASSLRSTPRGKAFPPIRRMPPPCSSRRSPPATRPYAPESLGDLYLAATEPKASAPAIKAYEEAIASGNTSAMRKLAAILLKGGHRRGRSEAGREAADRSDRGRLGRRQRPARRSLPVEHRAEGRPESRRRVPKGGRCRQRRARRGSLRQFSSRATPAFPPIRRRQQRYCAKRSPPAIRNGRPMCLAISTAPTLR